MVLTNRNKRVFDSESFKTPYQRESSLYHAKKDETMKKLGYVAGALLGVFLGLFLLSPFSASAASTQAKATHHTLTAPLSGTASNGDTFSGTFTVEKFVARHGQLLAVGTITGTLKKASSGVTSNAIAPQAITVPAALPVTSAAPGLVCNVLNLNLGPLHLNLLGLVVDLNQVILNITAQPGALLGNLLCSVAGLLNGGTPLAGLVTLLNEILAAL
jgi:hypothetical protein